jgi:hypothetical protein
MIECVFTIDYEIYGNGQGSLRELVYEPAERLMDAFQRADARFVNFVEAAELEMIESQATDPAIERVKEQVRRLRGGGFEIGLHLHPQWYNARYEKGAWVLDDAEYNLCLLKRERIEWIVEKAIGYLRAVLKEPEFVPLSFRAGNWLLQPSYAAAQVLADKGIRVDSSVFKGGVQRSRGLDYRRSLKNGYFWTFERDVNVEDAAGRLLEIPTYTRMVPFWRMLTSKRLGLQHKGGAAGRRGAGPSLRQRVNRLRDLFRIRYPLKLDFCRMTFDELRAGLEAMIREDRKSPALFKPVVAIGHTKDLTDFDTVTRFLSFLKDSGIKVSTFEDVRESCGLKAARQTAPSATR